MKQPCFSFLYVRYKHQQTFLAACCSQRCHWSSLFELIGGRSKTRPDHSKASFSVRIFPFPIPTMSLDQIHLLPLGKQQDILNGPALSPPPGIIPNLDDPPNHNEFALGVTTFLLVVSTIGAFLRAYAQLFCIKKLHIEDCKTLDFSFKSSDQLIACRHSSSFLCLRMPAPFHATYGLPVAD